MSLTPLSSRPWKKLRRRKAGCSLRSRIMRRTKARKFLSRVESSQSSQLISLSWQ